MTWHIGWRRGQVVLYDLTEKEPHAPPPGPNPRVFAEITDVTAEVTSQIYIGNEAHLEAQDQGLQEQKAADPVPASISLELDLTELEIEIVDDYSPFKACLLLPC